MFQLLIFIFLDLYTISSAQAELGTITISGISRTLDSSGRTLEPGDIQTTVRFTEIAKNFKDIDHFHLQVIIGDGSTQDQGISVSQTSTSAVFARDIDPLADTNVIFILTAQNNKDEDTHYGQVKLTLPETFLDANMVSGAWVGKTGDVSLRIKKTDDIHEYKLDGVSCIGDDTADVTKSCYFVGVKKEVNNPVKLCKDVNEESKVETIAICDETVKIDAENIGGATVTSSELKYPASGNGNILIAPVGEIVVYETDSTVVKVCYTSPCDIGSYSPSTETYNVLTVGVNGGDPQNSDVVQLTDYEVVGTGLSVDLIETRWTRNTDVGDIYKVSRTSNGDEIDNPFSETEVTCKNDEGAAKFHCFAYFVGLVGDSAYDLTVQENVATELKKITLTGTKTLAPGPGEVRGMELKLSSLDTRWHKGLRSFEVNTCINQADISDQSTYEAILINKRGQWKKVNGVTHTIGNELCFDALHVDIYNFDLSEDMTLVVVKRGYDGITVLETAQTDISVGGNQMAAAHRNSSSGTM